MTVFVDANIPMYVAGRDHEYKEPSTRFMRAVARRHVDAVSDVEILQEILYRYGLYRYGAVRRPSIGFAVFDTFIATIPRIHPVLLADLRTSRVILAEHPGVEPRDAIHIAVMRRNGVRGIVSYDEHFDGIPGIDRFTPDAVPA